MRPPADEIHLTRAELRELDRIAIEEYGLPGVVLMENAGRGAAEELLRALEEGRLGTRSRAPAVLVLCGAGNNGGDGYVLARHLSNAGLPVLLAESAPPERLSPDAAVFRRVCAAMGLERQLVESAQRWRAVEPRFEACELVVDALLGTGFQGALREPLAGLLAAVGAFVGRGKRSVLALDLPSGLDADSGEAAGEILAADLTITFAAKKVCFARPAARPWIGELRVAGIGAPPSLVERVRRAR